MKKYAFIVALLFLFSAHAQKVLYVHGLGSSPDGRTGTVIKDFFGEDKVFARKYHLLSFKKILSQLREDIAREKPDIIIGHSLGAYYLFLLRDPATPKIVINPPIRLSDTIRYLKTHKSPISILSWLVRFVSSDAHMIQRVENGLFNDITVHENYFGIFSRNDELFSFRSDFDALCMKHSKSILINGGHRPKSEELVPALTDAVIFFQ